MIPIYLTVAFFSHCEELKHSDPTNQNLLHRFNNNTFSAWQLSHRIEFSIEKTKSIPGVLHANTSRVIEKMTKEDNDWQFEGTWRRFWFNDMPSKLDGADRPKTTKPERDSNEDIRQIEGTWRRFWFNDMPSKLDGADRPKTTKPERDSNEDIRQIEGAWRRFWFNNDEPKNVVILLFDFSNACRSIFGSVSIPTR